MAYKVDADMFRGGMNILVYGPQGAGKTFFAGTAQDHKAMKDVLVLSIEGGLMTLASRGDIIAETIKSTAQLEEMFWKLTEIEKYPEYANIKTVVIDSITELQTVNLEGIVRESLGKRKDKTQDDVYQEDYGKSTTQLKRLLRYFRDLPLNVIYTALPKTVFSKSGEVVVSVEPMLTTKLSQSVMGYVDFVWYLYQQEVFDAEGKFERIDRYMLTRDSGVYRAKTRGVKFSEALGGKVRNPNLPGLYDLFIKSEGGTL